jgi:hypothetical protein
MKKQKTIYYFIFGEAFSNYYYEGLNVALEHIKSKSFEGAVIKHDTRKHSPADLLFNSDGWNGYAEITASEYKKLNNAIKEQGGN